MLFFFHKHEFCNLMYNISVFEGNTCLIEGHIYQTILGQFTVHISIPFISYLICFIIFITDYGLSFATRFSLFRTLCLIFFLQEEEHFLCRLTFTEVIKTHLHQQRNKSTITHVRTVKEIIPSWTCLFCVFCLKMHLSNTSSELQKIVLVILKQLVI